MPDAGFMESRTSQTNKLVSGSDVRAMMTGSAPMGDHGGILASSDFRAFDPPGADGSYSGRRTLQRYNWLCSRLQRAMTFYPAP